MVFEFRQACTEDHEAVWAILQSAIARRAADGSTQWQSGYPNAAVVQNDIETGVGFVLTLQNEIVGCCAVIVNDEPNYADIRGSWLTAGDFIVVHRVAVAEAHLGKGFAQAMLTRVEGVARSRSVPSIRIDTIHDNAAMLRVFERLGYTYCGEVLMGGSPRRAFEKILL